MVSATKFRVVLALLVVSALSTATQSAFAQCSGGSCSGYVVQSNYMPADSNSFQSYSPTYAGTVYSDSYQSGSGYSNPAYNGYSTPVYDGNVSYGSYTNYLPNCSCGQPMNAGVAYSNQGYYSQPNYGAGYSHPAYAQPVYSQSSYGVSSGGCANGMCPKTP